MSHQQKLTKRCYLLKKRKDCWNAELLFQEQPMTNLCSNSSMVQGKQLTVDLADSQ